VGILNFGYATLLCFLAGVVTGSIFNIRTLLIALGLILAGSTMLGLVQGAIAGLWTLVNVVWVEVGYLAGIYARCIFEYAGNFRQNSDA
jgi:hypothetical protein